MRQLQQQGVRDGRIISERGDQPTTDPYHPSAAWYPSEADTFEQPAHTMQGLANCGVHYGYYDQASIKVGDMPCPNMCSSSIGFKKAQPTHPKGAA